MFKLAIDDRLSAWADLRSRLETDADPLTTADNFWRHAPFVPYNHKIDPFNPHYWPTPWEIIVENKYDDFTRALMIAYTLKYTKKFSESKIEIHTLVDKDNNIQYNIVSIDEEWGINYAQSGPIQMKKVPSSFSLENLVVIKSPR